MSVIAGVAGSEKPAGRLTAIVSALSSALVAVKPTVQVERALPVCGEPVNDTAVGAAAARIVTGVALAALESLLVLTVSVDEPGDVFVIPAIVSVAGVVPVSEQVPPLLARVIVATAPAPPVAVAEQFEKPATSVITGVAGIEKPVVKVVVIWSPARSPPVAVGVKFTVQVARA